MSTLETKKKVLRSLKKSESSLLPTAFHLHLDAKTESTRETRRDFEKQPLQTSPREVFGVPSASAPSQPQRIERVVPGYEAHVHFRFHRIWVPSL